MSIKLKNTKLIELNEAYQKVLYWFFSFPEKEITLTDLSEVVQISKTTAHRVVKRLEKEGFLKIETLGRIWRIFCDQNHEFNFSKKLTFNLSMIYQSNILNEIKKIINNPRAIILFGSYRRGDDSDSSDIDIAVEVIDEQDLTIIPLGIIKQFGYRKNVKVNLHVFTRDNVDINLFSNIANGILLDGFLEVSP